MNLESLKFLWNKTKLLNEKQETFLMNHADEKNSNISEWGTLNKTLKELNYPNNENVEFQSGTTHSMRISDSTHTESANDSNDNHVNTHNNSYNNHHKHHNMNYNYKSYNPLSNSPPFSSNHNAQNLHYSIPKADNNVEADQERQSLLQRMSTGPKLGINTRKLITSFNHDGSVLPPCSFFRLTLPNFDSFHISVSFMLIYYKGLVMNRFVVQSKTASNNTPQGKSDRVNNSNRRGTPISAVSPDRFNESSDFVLSFFEEKLDPFNRFTSIKDELHNEGTSDKVEIWFLNEKMEYVSYCAINMSIGENYELQTFPIVFFDANQGTKSGELNELFVTWEKMNSKAVKKYIFSKRNLVISKRNIFNSPSSQYLPFAISPSGSAFHFKFNFASVVKYWSIFFGSNVYVMLYSRKNKQVVGEIEHVGRIMEYTKQVPQKIPSTGVDFEALSHLETLRLQFAASLDTDGICELERGAYFDETLCLLLVFSKNNPPTLSSNLQNQSEFDRKFENIKSRSRTVSNPVAAASFISPRRNAPVTPTSGTSEREVLRRFNSVKDLNEFVNNTAVSRSNNRSPGSPSLSNSTYSPIENSSLGYPVAFAVLSLYSPSENKEFLSNGLHNLTVYQGFPNIPPWTKSKSVERVEDPLAMMKPENLLCDVTTKAIFQHDEIIQDACILKCICKDGNKSSMDEVLVNLVHTNGQILKTMVSEFEIWRHLTDVVASIQSLYELSVEYALHSNYDTEGRVLLAICTHFDTLTELVLNSNSHDIKSRFKQDIHRKLSSKFLGSYIKVMYSRSKRSIAGSEDFFKNSLTILSSFRILSHIITLLSEKSDDDKRYYFDVCKSILSDINSLFAKFNNHRLDAPISKLLLVMKELLPACYSLQVYDPSIGNLLSTFFANLKEFADTNLANKYRCEFFEFIQSVYCGAISQSSNNEISKHIPDHLRYQKSFVGLCAQIISTLSTERTEFSPVDYSLLYSVLRTLFEDFVHRKISSDVEDVLKEPKSLIQLELYRKLFPLHTLLLDLLEENFTRFPALNENSIFLLNASQYYMLQVIKKPTIFNSIMQQIMPTLDKTETFFSSFLSVQATALQRLAIQDSDYELLNTISENLETIIQSILSEVLLSLSASSPAWASAIQIIVLCLRSYAQSSVLVQETPRIINTSHESDDEDLSSSIDSIEDRLWHLLRNIVITDIGAGAILHHPTVCNQLLSLVWFTNTRSRSVEDCITLILYLLSLYNLRIQRYPQILMKSLMQVSKKQKDGLLENIIQRLEAITSMEYHTIEPLNNSSISKTWIKHLKPNEVSDARGTIQAFSSDCVEFVYSSYYITLFDNMKSKYNLDLDDKWKFFYKFPGDLKNESLKIELHVSAATISQVSMYLRLGDICEARRILKILLHLLYNIEAWKELANCTLLYIYLQDKEIQKASNYIEVDTTNPYVLFSTFSSIISTGEGFYEFMENISRHDYQKVTITNELLLAASHFFLLAGNGQLSLDILHRLREYYEYSRNLDNQIQLIISIHEKIIQVYKQLQTGAKRIGNIERYVILSIRHLVNTDHSVSSLSIWKSGDYIIQLRHNEDIMQFVTVLKAHFPHFKILMPQDVLPLQPVSSMIKIAPACDESKVQLLSKEAALHYIHDINVRCVTTYDPIHEEEPYGGVKELTYSKQCLSTKHYGIHALPTISRYTPVDISRSETQYIDQVDLLSTWFSGLLQGIDKCSPFNEEYIDSDMENVVTEQILSILLDSSQPYLDSYIYGFEPFSNVDKLYDAYQAEKQKNAKYELSRLFIQETKLWKEKVKTNPDLPPPVRKQIEETVFTDERIDQLRIWKENALKHLSKVYLWLVDKNSQKDGSNIENIENDSTRSQNDRIARLEKAMSNILWG